jgi:hypothetical protein
MQKFVIKKISRSTNITISAEDQCCEENESQDLEKSNVKMGIKMCGYLKKKRNVSDEICAKCTKTKYF